MWSKANSLIASELAGLALAYERFGYRVELCRKEETWGAGLKTPPTGCAMWSGDAPDLIVLHQATPNHPGGTGSRALCAMRELAEACASQPTCHRVVMDASRMLSTKYFMNQLRRKCVRSQWQSDVDRETGPNEYACTVANWIDNVGILEVGYAGARGNDTDNPFHPLGVFGAQLELTREWWKPQDERDYTLCYIGASRANAKHRDARVALIGDLVNTENSFFGGTLFGPGSVSFDKTMSIMANSDAHLICRDKGMTQKPNHRYLQALAMEAIPIILGEPEPVDFVHDEVLQKVLREDWSSLVNSPEAMADKRKELLPRLREELEYWLEFERKAGEGL